MALVLTEYATGQWTLSTLTDHLTVRGLTTLATPNRPSHPLDHNKLLDPLCNPYYRGVVTYQGVECPGKHQALVDDATQYQVQTVLNQRRYGERQRVHNHRLKTTIRCGQCGERPIIHKCKSRSGQIYPYFVCSRRQRHRNTCSFKVVLIDEVDARVIETHERIRISIQDRRIIERYLVEGLYRICARQYDHVKDLYDQRTKL